MSVTWDNRFMDLARHIAGWSKDPNTQVGAVIVNEERVIIGTGYNGFPRGVSDSPARLFNRDLKLKFIVHAEMNAILNASANVKGATLYTWPLPPCTDCMKFVVQAGIKRIVYLEIEDPTRKSKWDITEESRMMCKEAGVTLYKIDVMPYGPKVG